MFEIGRHTEHTHWLHEIMKLRDFVGKLMFGEQKASETGKKLSKLLQCVQPLIH